MLTYAQQWSGPGLGSHGAGENVSEQSSNSTARLNSSAGSSEPLRLSNKPRLISPTPSNE
jgi:hypothetical protein